MSRKTERLQVLIDVEQRGRLERVAAARGTSVATLVREAIDLAFPSAAGRRAACAAAVLDAEPMEVPPVEELLAELDGLRAQRR